MATAITAVEVQHCIKCCGGEDMYSAIALCLAAELRRNHIEDVPKREDDRKSHICPFIFILERQKCPSFFGCLWLLFSTFWIVKGFDFCDLSSSLSRPFLCSMRPLLPCDSDAAGADSRATFSLLFFARPDLFFSPRLCVAALPPYNIMSCFS